MNHEPTDAALRAAERISNAWRWDITFDEIAAIIDRETRLPELMKALQPFATYCEMSARNQLPHGATNLDGRDYVKARHELLMLAQAVPLAKNTP